MTANQLKVGDVAWVDIAIEGTTERYQVKCESYSVKGTTVELQFISSPFEDKACCGITSGFDLKKVKVVEVL